MSLPTVTLKNVELLEADRVLHGAGSPEAGDTYSVKDLRAMVDAAAELGDEWLAPATIDHSRSGPALGWVEGLRVEGRKLVADIRQVPARFAEVVRAGGFRSRSCELKRIRGQRSGKDHLTVGAVSWLGARSPAARTLADPETFAGEDALENVVALYAGAGTEVVRAFSFEDSSPSPSTSEGLETSDDVRRHVDRLVLAGRIPREEAESWTRAFVTNPQLAETWLAEDHPDPFTGRPAATDEAFIAAQLKIPLAEVI